jgi:hypothetical protein
MVHDLICLDFFITFLWDSKTLLIVSFDCGTEFFWELHSTTQTLTTRTYTHPYEYMYANPAPMSTSEGLGTSRSADSRSHHWHLVDDGNIAYHLMHNARKSLNKSRKRCEHQDLNPGGYRSTRPSYHWTTDSFAYCRTELDNYTTNLKKLEILMGWNYTTNLKSLEILMG